MMTSSHVIKLVFLNSFYPKILYSNNVLNVSRVCVMLNLTVFFKGRHVFLYNPWHETEESFYFSLFFLLYRKKWYKIQFQPQYNSQLNPYWIHEPSWFSSSLLKEPWSVCWLCHLVIVVIINIKPAKSIYFLIAKQTMNNKSKKNSHSQFYNQNE
jgi:hypothetical protein